MALPLESMGNEYLASLHAQKNDAEILGPAPDSDLAKREPQAPGGLPAYLARLYDVPLLTREQEAHLFRKMNYLKYSASRLRDELDCDRPKSHLTDQIEKLYDESVATRNQIVRANLRLVVSIVKRYMTPATDLFELISDGNVSLLRAVEKFDYSRGTSFSTYATTAIVRNLARGISDEIHHRNRFVTNEAEILSNAESFCAERNVENSPQPCRESHVKRILGCLSERELQIITGRYGLNRSRGLLTFKQLGAKMGVSKERIRQIQCRAIDKLRKAAEDGQIDFDAATASIAQDAPPGT